ncbi:MAG: DUF3710 domain-containing protein [Propionibacteriaceae bacterium]|nr:DUF3710 domain-containing protein [Propionibacteriaceae bacterium]
MIFGRKKKTEPDSSQDEDVSEVVQEDAEDADEAEDAVDDETEDGDLDEDEAVTDEWALFDVSQDWREDGPFDIDEVDLSADEVQRIDLGAVIITPETGMNVKLLASPQTNQILHLTVEHGPQSRLQMTVFAAPQTGDYCAEIREMLIAQTPNAKVVTLAKGPFGTELRRVVTATDEKGREGFAPLRDWLVAGPRWVLNARLIGQAALHAEGGEAAEQFEEFVRNTIVRRGDQAMVPGSVVPLSASDKK